MDYVAFFTGGLLTSQILNKNNVDAIPNWATSTEISEILMFPKDRIANVLHNAHKKHSSLSAHIRVKINEPGRGDKFLWNVKPDCIKSALQRLIDNRIKKTMKQK